MADSIILRSRNEDRFSRIHSNLNNNGRLYRGHNIVAASATIPSKYQTIVISNTERKGFDATARRFNHDLTVKDCPGPGTYKTPLVKQDSSSFSKKGTGGFASKDKRSSKHIAPVGPGPLAYKVSATYMNQKDFNKAGCSSNFHRPIAVERQRPDFPPGPNQYNLMDFKKGKANNVEAGAAFRSKSKRETIVTGEASRVPAPSQYDVKDSLLKHAPKVPFSSFKSKTRRDFVHPRTAPGPGWYHPHEEVEPAEKMTFPKRHYLCISAPAMPLPQLPPQPGPGAYEVRGGFDKTKHYMSGSVFVSNTGRWNNGPQEEELPGPAHYRPDEPNRQSFLYNSSKRWV